MKTKTLYITAALFAVVVVGLALLFVGGLVPGGVVPDTPQKTGIRIVKGSFSSTQRENFSPKLVRVVIGTNSTITWINDDSEWHDVKGPGFQSPMINPGEQFKYTFTKPGEFSYTCTPHPWMSGTIVVQHP